MLQAGLQAALQTSLVVAAEVVAVRRRCPQGEGWRRWWCLLQWLCWGVDVLRTSIVVIGLWSTGSEGLK